MWKEMAEDKSLSHWGCLSSSSNRDSNKCDFPPQCHLEEINCNSCKAFYCKPLFLVQFHKAKPYLTTFCEDPEHLISLEAPGQLLSVRPEVSAALSPCLGEAATACWTPTKLHRGTMTWKILRRGPDPVRHPITQPSA